VLERIRRAIREPQLSHLLTYNATRGERDLALALDLPLYGPDPRHHHLGTKSGSRELFALAAIPHPLGVEHIRTQSRCGPRDRPPTSDQAPAHGARDQAQPWRLGRRKRVHRPRRPARPGRRRRALADRAASDGAGPHRRLGRCRCLSREARRPRGHRRRADHRPRASQPQPVPGHARRRRRAALDPRPDPRRSQRTELSRVPLSRRPALRAHDRARSRTAPLSASRTSA
jgi:hypothetical protein